MAVHWGSSYCILNKICEIYIYKIILRNISMWRMENKENEKNGKKFLL